MRDCDACLRQTNSGDKLFKKIQFPDVTYKLTCCNQNCQKYPIYGNVLTCTSCPDYYICESCMDDFDHEHPLELMINQAKKYGMYISTNS